jgi:hypothetical protein
VATECPKGQLLSKNSQDFAIKSGLGDLAGDLVGDLVGDLAKILSLAVYSEVVCCRDSRLAERALPNSLTS